MFNPCNVIMSIPSVSIAMGCKQAGAQTGQHAIISDHTWTSSVTMSRPRNSYGV